MHQTVFLFPDSASEDIGPEELRPVLKKQAEALIVWSGKLLFQSNACPPPNSDPTRSRFRQPVTSRPPKSGTVVLIAPPLLQNLAKHAVPPPPVSYTVSWTLSFSRALINSVRARGLSARRGAILFPASGVDGR
uniref:Uncharacterized protein n=1 Tax=Leptospirillum ferrodiazotrophum TaxID=412449 RepID=C6HWR2_9BACT|nr:MAG: hypothetical protein UBAL3_80630094 [Leptospirillum ferrodiazotrophum]